MATLNMKLTNTDGTIPLNKNYTIDDSLVPYFLAAYGSVYVPPANSDGTPSTPYTNPQICELWADGIVEGVKNFVNSYLVEQARQQALANVPALNVTTSTATPKGK